MRGFGSICAILLVLAVTGMARAADSTPAPETPTPEQTAALAALNPAASEAGIRAVVTGLRQSLLDNGLSRALGQASDWVKELEITWTAHRNGRATTVLDTQTEAVREAKSVRAALATKNAPLDSHLSALNLGLVSFGTGGAESEVWTLGHAQPLAALVTAGDVAVPRSEDHGLITNGDPQRASHDIQFGLRVPMLPWKATIAGDRYWWGASGFGQQIEGTRVGLKLNPVENIEIEGGRADDTRGNGGFLGVLYRVPLDQAK